MSLPGGNTHWWIKASWGAEVISIITLKQFRKRLMTTGREERTTKVNPWVTGCSHFPNSHVESLSSGISESESEVKLLSRAWLFATPWTVAHQAPLSMGFSRQESWSGLPFSPPGDLTNPGIKPAFNGRFFTVWVSREALNYSSVTGKFIFFLLPLSLPFFFPPSISYFFSFFPPISLSFTT